METNEIRAVIKYLCKKGISPKEIYEDMRIKKKWVAAFKLGRISTENEHRPGRPVESVTQENIDKIHDLVMLDRRMTVRQIEETLGIPKTTVDRIMREHLGLRKLSACWVPKLLTPDQKAVRRKLSSDNLALFEANPEKFVNRFVTMDETWAHHFTPESKQQSMQWRHSGSPPPKKAKTVPSAGKVMVSVFWDSEGVLLLDSLNKGQTINGNYYANLVKQLREAIKEKRRGKLSRKIVYHQDNAPSHRSLPWRFRHKYFWRLDVVQELIQSSKELAKFLLRKGLLNIWSYSSRILEEKRPKRLSLKKRPKKTRLKEIRSKKAKRNNLKLKKAKLKKIKIKTLLRSSVTKGIKEIGAEFDKEYPSRDSILVMFKLLGIDESQLRNANSQIRELMLDDESTTMQELEKEQDLVKQYERNFLLTEKKVTDYLNPRGNDQQGQGDVASIRSSPERSASCRLPKIALKVYDGTSLEWLGWWSQFEAIHENPNLSEVDKFQYLIQSMKVGTRAERLVKSYPLTEANYPKVIEALRDRFGDKVILTEVYVRQLLKLVINNVRKKNISLESSYDQVTPKVFGFPGRECAAELFLFVSTRGVQFARGVD
ncbi:hypothetical protein LAZ67_4003322 [Cordylochernes scorpioides]|uniref:Transposase n=1 Tax=Cordylochernes scorpioides TaxID=51811 RepID=A0ABY6KGL4_9ARAC|nr:hypothetical protein LAZ67_4003322 [Cordylochernes scorpioides]